MTYLYRGYPGGLVTVTENGDEHPLRHLVAHSPDGFNWGYAGSGPSDLARSIIGHLLGIDDPHPALYQAFKFAFIAGLPRDESWAIHEVVIRDWLAEQNVCEDCGGRYIKGSHTCPGR